MARPKKPTYEWIESRKEFRKRIKGPNGKYISLYAQTPEELTEKIAGVQRQIEEEVYRYATIKYILQPIVENALVQGIEGTGTVEQPCTICISGKKDGEDIIFTVSDDGCGIPEAKVVEMRMRMESDEMFQKSIGIYNVSSRLRIVYGPSYRLGIDSGQGRGTTVTIRVKAMKKRELEEYVQTVDR